MHNFQNNLILKYKIKKKLNEKTKIELVDDKI